MPEGDGNGDARALVQQLCRILHVPLHVVHSELAPAATAAVEASHAAALQSMLVQLAAASPPRRASSPSLLLLPSPVVRSAPRVRPGACVGGTVVARPESAALSPAAPSW